VVKLTEELRRAIVKGIAFDFGLLEISLLGIRLVWLVARAFFRHMSPYFADVV
jgi:hypothetical protein